MGRKILILIMVFCLFLAITSCSFDKTNSSSSNSVATLTKPVETLTKPVTTLAQEDKSEIILSSGTVPNELRIVGVKDAKNFYCFTNNNKNIIIYNVENRSKTVLVSTMSPEKYIKSICANENWIVWAEDEVQIEDDFSNEKNWSVYAKNLKTQELLEIDRYKEIKLEPASISKKIEPAEFSIYDDKIVYNCYDVLKGKIVCAVIKLYNLSKKTLEIIDSNKNYADGFYSYPKIYKNTITWSLSKCKLDDYSEKGSIYTYDLNSKEKKIITSGNDILWPYIYQNYIAARVKPNGQNENSSIVLLDINDGKHKWNTVVSSKSTIYKDSIHHIEIGMPVISGSYLIWQDNIRNCAGVYDYVNKKTYKLSERSNESEFSGVIGIFKNIIFWYETSNKGNLQASVTKYAVLKDK